MARDEARAAGAATRERNGSRYVLGTTADVDWIQSGTTATLAITSAIPPVFEAYATIVIPVDERDQQAHDAALLTVLAREVGGPWWLGYLEQGPLTDVVFPDAPRVLVYTGGYVLIKGGPKKPLAFGPRTASGTEARCRT